MSSVTIEYVDTNLEAYKLVYDPTRLLSLLYSKYGDIEEDYYLSYINQIFYNVTSHYNSIYKENQYIDNIDEFLKRFYHNHESTDRVPKLSDYYKNYLKFFCRPLFRNYILGKLLHDYQDRKAEIFYKNNYADSINEIEEKEKEKENMENKSSSSLSSLDNITDNKIIFDKRTKNIIDNNLNSDLCTITLTLESSRTNLLKDNDNNNKASSSIYNGCLISKRSNGNSSFEKYIYSLVNYHWNKKMKNKNKKGENSKKSPNQRKKKLANSPSTHTPYLSKIYKKTNIKNQHYINKDFYQKNKNIKSSLYALAKKNYVKNSGFISYKNNKGFLSPKTNKYSMNFNNGISKLEEFNKNRPNNYINFIQSSSKKNKTYNITNVTNNNTNKTNKIKNINFKNLNFTNTNTNTIYKNFSNLSSTLNKFKNMKNKNSNITYSIKNNSGIAKPKKNHINSINVLIKSNNNENKTKKKVNITNANKTINNNNSNNNQIKSNNINVNKPQHIKNKTFDFNTINQSEPLSKYNSNNNFDNFKALLSNTNKNSQKRKKINSKFNLVKKPFNEVIKNPILSPQLNNKVYSKISINKSISQNKDKKKKIFYGISNNNSNSNNFNNQQTKFDNERESPKDKKSNKKINSMTFSNDDYNKIECINIDGLIKKNNNKENNSKKQIKKSNQNSNKFGSNKSNLCNNIWKSPISSASPLSNYTTNLNTNNKNSNYTNYSNIIRMENSSSINNKSDGIKPIPKLNHNNYNNLNANIENINHNININKTVNDEFIDMINMNQNDNCVISRNKKQNNSKISITQSQEVNLKDIHVKSVKNLKAKNCIEVKNHLKNMTCSNDSNHMMKKYKLNYNYGKINSSTEVKNNRIKDVLFKLNKISIKKKPKKNSQRNSKKKDKNIFYIKPKNKFKNRGMLSGDNIFSRKKIIEMKQNSLNINSRTIQKDKNNAKSNNTISHRERGNSLVIINVNRNINLIHKNESKNLQKMAKINI